MHASFAFAFFPCLCPKISFSFDPFRPDVKGIRHAMVAFSYEYVKGTNLKCTFKTDIKSDGSEPIMKVQLKDDPRPIIFKLGNLSGFETLYQFNKIVLPLVQSEEEESPKETKATKKAAGGKKNKKR